MTPRLRADAERNRTRLLDVARERRDSTGAPPTLAALAACAGLGVGTVYRHFPTQAALAEALAVERLQELLAGARATATSGDPAGIEQVLTAAVRMLVGDPSLAGVFAAASDATPEAAEVKAALLDVFGALATRAADAGLLRADLGVADLHHLVCGFQLALRLAPDADDATTERYVSVLLAGIRPAAGQASGPSTSAGATESSSTSSSTSSSRRSS